MPFNIAVSGGIALKIGNVFAALYFVFYLELCSLDLFSDIIVICGKIALAAAAENAAAGADSSVAVRAGSAALQS